MEAPEKEYDRRPHMPSREGDDGEKLVPACPNDDCDSWDVWSRRRSLSHKSWIDSDAPKWRCRQCGGEFESVKWRERRAHSSAGVTSPGGQALLEADPEDWP